MYLPLQYRLKLRLPNIHGRHSATAIGESNILNKVLGLILGNHPHDGATLLPWPTEMALVVAGWHQDGVAQVFPLEKIHQQKGLHAVGI